MMTQNIGEVAGIHIPLLKKFQTDKTCSHHYAFVQLAEEKVVSKANSNVEDDKQGEDRGLTQMDAYYSFMHYVSKKKAM